MKPRLAALPAFPARSCQPHRSGSCCLPGCHIGGEGSLQHSGPRAWWGLCDPRAVLQPLALHRWGTAAARHARAIGVVALEGALCEGGGLHLSNKI